MEPKQNSRVGHRRSVRLAGYDYAEGGAYFVTICAAEKRCVFGRVREATMELHPYGRIANACWAKIPEHYQAVQLDECVVMPNHVHGILLFTAPSPSDQLADFSAPKARSLATVINQYKGAVTRTINASRAAAGLAPAVVWQSRFYDRIIRNERELDAIRNYIVENPQRWHAASVDRPRDR